MTRHLSRFSRIAVFTSSALLGACSMTRTSTEIHTMPGPLTKHARLIRSDATRLLAEWQQDGRHIRGQLTLPSSCQTEMVQVTRRERVTETKSNPAYTTTAFIVGGVVSALGIGLMAASSKQDDEVQCGDYEGATCQSVQGAFLKAGAVTLGLGAGLVLGGALVATRDPVVETVALPAERRVKREPESHVCTELSTLRGLTVTAELQDGSRWSGAADARGVIAIELSELLSWKRPLAAKFSVDSVPVGATEFIARGLSLGELTLEPPAR